MNLSEKFRQLAHEIDTADFSGRSAAISILLLCTELAERVEEIERQRQEQDEYEREMRELEDG